ncbi:MAG: M16 family metallopeptidase [Petrotogales bacterium]
MRIASSKISPTIVEELPNNATLVRQHMGDRKTVSVAFAVKVGSAYEEDSNSGISHFVEHTVFKGTKSRNTFDIKEPIERVGGTLNAYTGRVATVFFAQMPVTHIDEAMEILFDLVLNPSFDKQAIELEKQVILEEISEAEDDPLDYIYDMTIKKIWDKNFGRPVLGTRETVSRFTRDQIFNFHNQMYSSDKMIFAITGNYSDEVICKIKRMLSFLPNTSGDNSYVTGSIKAKPVYFSETRKDLKQTHILLSKPGPGRTTEDDFEAFRVFNVFFGSGMSSILFHNIREKQGMVYNIHSEYVAYKDFGSFFINASTNPRNVDKLLESIRREMQRLKSDGVKNNELNYGKERLKGKLMMSTESTLATMSRHIDEMITMGYPSSIEDILEKIDSLTVKKVSDVINNHLSGKWNISILSSKNNGSNISFEL